MAATPLDIQPAPPVTQSRGELALTGAGQGVGRWWVLTRGGQTAHLDTGREDGAAVTLTGEGLAVGAGRPCKLDAAALSDIFARHPEPFHPVCDGQLWVRTAHAGYQTRLEAVTDLLRSTSLGEMLINAYKDVVPVKGVAAQEAPGGQAGAVGGPPAAALPARAVRPVGLGIPVEGAAPGAPLAVGHWYGAAGAPGAWASVATVGDAAPGQPGAEAMAYLMAIDLDGTASEYVLGTDHPGVGWSSRPGVARQAPGPDGFADTAPFVRTGVVPPWDQPRLLATFSGGYKREHGAFRSPAPVAGMSNGGHYGFAEGGVVLSRLQPGLATLLRTRSGGLAMRTWGSGEAAPADLVYARQGGFPLVEGGEIGPMVDSGRGNWSGSYEGKLQTMRSGACLVERGGRRWLVYGVFTSATPPGMAALFKSYGCSYAMQLDMNAPELTYAALYRQDKDGPHEEVLYTPMADNRPGGKSRFSVVADSRDFFYVVRAGR
jgi:hypothetical protein